MSEHSDEIGARRMACDGSRYCAADAHWPSCFTAFLGRVEALADDLSGVTGARYIADALQRILADARPIPPEVGPS